MIEFLSNPGFPILGFALLLAVLDWIAVATNRARLEAGLKPAVMLLIIFGAWQFRQGPHDPWQLAWFLPGLFLSGVGDVLLLHPPTPPRFAGGLAAFLMAHCCYIIGLNPTFPSLLSLIPAVILWTINFWIHRRLIQGVRASDHPKLVIPVALYSAVLGLLLLSACATFFRPEWTPLRRGLVSLGAGLFVISDSLLGWRRFVTPEKPSRVWVMSTYHLAQLALTISIVS